MNAHSKRIQLLDTSLRDGEQSPGCSMSAKQKLRFAHALRELGVDCIEAGFAASSEVDANGIAAIAREVRGVGIASLCRCTPGDIQAAARALEHAERPRIHLFLSTSPVHREHKLGMSKQQVLDLTASSVELAARLVGEVEFSAEDALRTEPEYLAQVLQLALASGSRILNVPDTVGYTTPGEIRALFEYLRRTIANADQAILSAHCHNDLGMAVANTLAAIEGGAMQVECTVQVQRNKAIVGANAFAHESGIHQHGMLRHRDTYEIIRPEDVGVDRSQMVLGRHSGRAALIERLAFLGYVLDDAALGTLFAQFKTLAEKKKEVFDADLEALLASDDGQSIDGWRLKAFHISTGAGEGTRPAAAVEIRDASGTALRGRATGDGPVHALFEALAAATGTAFMIESYQVGSVSTGEDALGQASVITLIDDEEINGVGTSTDILEASALAWLDVANRLARRERGRITQVADRARVATA
ncbi:MAG: 2-isopropylmalate synthase [Gammaproteobacteria bacterium HGW-Gammaproteobacteria-2]|nr:MAG: 2-isopropylmalate synthase [Gammaproteobacteria bacterium HGW-Gammaproteobacteria-2]